MGLVNRLTERDLKMVTRDRNVADGVRAAARKFVASGQARRRPGSVRATRLANAFQ